MNHQHLPRPTRYANYCIPYPLFKGGICFTRSSQLCSYYSRVITIWGWHLIKEMSTAHDTFQPRSHFISNTGMIRRWRLPSYAENAVRWMKVAESSLRWNTTWYRVIGLPVPASMDGIWGLVCYKSKGTSHQLWDLQTRRWDFRYSQHSRALTITTSDNKHMLCLEVIPSSWHAHHMSHRNQLLEACCHKLRGHETPTILSSIVKMIDYTRDTSLLSSTNSQHLLLSSLPPLSCLCNDTNRHTSSPHVLSSIVQDMC